VTTAGLRKPPDVADTASPRTVNIELAASDTHGEASHNLVGAVQSLRTLLKIESESRQAKSLDELWWVAANECRRAIIARQIYVFTRHGRSLRMAAVSSLAKVDRESPTVVWLEGLAADWARTPATDVRVAVIGELAGGRGDVADMFPFKHCMLAALRHGEQEPHAYLLAVREQAFGEPETAAAERLAGAFGYAAAALGITRRRKLWGRSKLVLAAGLAALAAALVFVRTPLAVLAPAEIVARDSFAVTAPVEGVIDQVVADANQPVRAGDALVRLADTVQRNQLAIAEQELAVAEAKWRQISLAAFNDPAARRELTIVTTERDLKRAERAYAAELLGRMTIRAERDGLAIYADRRELVGRPVQIGQRLIEIADPSRMRIRAMASVDDAMALSPGARLKFYPDADPLNAVEAIVADAAHQARQNESGALAFRVDADVPAEALHRLRIGHRGTAQISGESVSLGFFLFRRPISALRQRFGL
jgi:multidrug resistance efflux pump